jgi:hypothetical protein
MKITGKQSVEIEISEAQRHLIALDYIHLSLRIK